MLLDIKQSYVSLTTSKLIDVLSNQIQVGRKLTLAVRRCDEKK